MPGVAFTHALPLYVNVCPAATLVIVAEKFPPPVPHVHAETLLTGAAHWRKFPAGAVVDG
jgi:hypothetical protein